MQRILEGDYGERVKSRSVDALRMTELGAFPREFQIGATALCPEKRIRLAQAAAQI
jgi:hypothetical protein